MSFKKTTTILDSDIMYQDDLVCILKPHVKKGIIVWTNFTQPIGKESLCKLGLKTGKKLKEEGFDFGRTKIHPYIFFKAPFYSNDIDYTSPETEIVCCYGDGHLNINQRVYIRVDPNKTYVFSSEIRDIFKHSVWQKNVDNVILNSKKLLTNYLEIIKDNMRIEKDVKCNKKIWYNLFSSRAVLFTENACPKEPYDIEPINFNSEILISLPHLTPDYFVLSKP